MCTTCPTLDAIGRSDSIDFICCRHEQGAVHAADGYARATGNLGVALTSTGPGAANAMGGLFEANYASTPVLMITGQADSAEFGRGRGTIHQAENQLAMLRTVTKRAEHIDHADDIAATIMSVAGDMLIGGAGPGAVEIPINMQYGSAEVGDLTIAGGTASRHHLPEQSERLPMCWLVHDDRSSSPVAA